MLPELENIYREKKYKNMSVMEKKTCSGYVLVFGYSSG